MAFDVEYAKQQIRLYPTDHLKSIYSKKDTNEYVPAYFDLVKLELKTRGIDPDAPEKTADPANPKDAQPENVHLVKDRQAASIVMEKIKATLNFAGLSTDELAQLYSYESRTPYLMSVIEAELRKRGQDPSQFIAKEPAEQAAEEAVNACSDCGIQLNPKDNFCPNCGAPLTKAK